MGKTHVAESYVYRHPGTGVGFVGRDPGQGFPGQTVQLVAKPGDELTAEEVKALGLKDLTDRCDYSHTEGWEENYELPLRRVAVDHHDEDGKLTGRTVELRRVRGSGSPEEAEVVGVHQEFEAVYDRRGLVRLKLKDGPAASEEEGQ